jgi:hypothetical protein
MFPESTGYEAFVFTGDRYHLQTGAVVATGDDAGPWFNIACFGGSTAKMGLLRYWEPAADLLETSAVQRTAARHMFRASYCGDGIPWTDQGTAIDFANRAGSLRLNDRRGATRANTEAIWTKDGAFCLLHPRRKEVEAKAVLCNGQAIQECTDAHIANWKTHGEFITIVP